MKGWVSPLAWGLCAVALASMAGASVMQELLGHANDDGVVEHIALLLGFASFPVIGALIASRRPRNAVGWIFLQVGVGVGILLVATEYTYLAFVKEPGEWPGATLAAWLEQWLWFPGLMAIPTLGLLLFPDGQPPTPRWRWLVWATGAAIAVVTFASMFQGRLEGEGYSLENPVGFLPFEDGEKAVDPVLFAFFGLMFLCLASLIVRFRRAGAEQRQQLKLLLLAAVTFSVAIFLGDTFDLPEIIFPLVLWTIPGAIGVAILKYRLYDIDAIINRTLVYGVLTAILAFVYFGLVVALQQTLGRLTEESDLAVAGSTLAVAALFRPLRARLQAFIDRRFYRRKYNARLTLESFSSRLREDVDLDHLARDLTKVVQETMQPAHVSVWLRPQGAEVLPS
ncbi:MAG: hypothetical protein M3N53_12085 [Actinomycetota bacterium]|nr:hypothetical protein [Actinomycetota bacterium]